MQNNSFNQNKLLNDIPKQYANTYTDNVEDYQLVYNSLSKRGLSILNKAEAFYFSLIDGKRSIGDILKLAQKVDKRVKIDDITQFFNHFYKSEIIYFDESKKLNVLPVKTFNKLSIWLHITNQCNLRCKYCYVNKSLGKMSMSVANEAVEKIFLSASKHGFKTIKFSICGGEPVLELPKILTLMKKIRVLNNKYNINSQVDLISNGTLITEKIAQTIKDNKIGLQISIDGLEQYNDQTRIFPSGKGSYRFIEKGLDNLQKVGVVFNVIIVITAKNVAGIPDFIKYLLSRNIKYTFNFYRENPAAKDKLMCDKDVLINTLKRVYKYLYQNPPGFTLLNQLDKVRFSPRLNTCIMGTSYFAVRHDGKIASCQMSMDTEIGSINDKDLIETMKKGNFIRPKGLTVDGKIPCRTCLWKYICVGGCPYFANQYFGKFDTKSPYCEVFKALIPVLLRTEAKRLIKYKYREIQKFQA